jgi:hypothetical protein
MVSRLSRQLQHVGVDTYTAARDGVEVDVESHPVGIDVQAEHRPERTSRFAR